MSEYVLDVLYIKKIEREIGRKLDEMDMEYIRNVNDEPIFLQKAERGEWASYFVPKYRFPYDVMLQLADLGLAQNVNKALRVAWFHHQKDKSYV